MHSSLASRKTPQQAVSAIMGRMKFAQDHINSKYLIEAYESGLIRVGGKDYRHNLLLMPNQLKTTWSVSSFHEVQKADLDLLIEQAPDLILFGTGARPQFLHPKCFAPIINAGIGYEIMPTHSACHTFNILLAEDRRVLAALII